MPKRMNGTGTLYKRGGVYYAKTKVGGKVVRQSLKTGDRDAAIVALNKLTVGHDLDDAARLAAIQSVLARSVDPDAPTDPRKVNIADAWGKFDAQSKARFRSAPTVLNDHGRWAAFVAWLYGRAATAEHVAVAAHYAAVRTLADVTAKMAREYIEFADGAVSPCTRNKYLVTLRGVWRACGVRSGGPWADIPRKRAPGHLRRVLTKDELAAVFHVATGEAHTLFLVGTFAGLRLGDARHLEWRQVDVERGALVVTPHKTRATSGREAVIPLHPELAAELARVPPEQRQGFVMPKMATATANHVNEIVRRIFAAAGIKTQAHVAGYRNAAVEVGFHSLRVTFVSMMGNAGVPLALVQAMVGHMSPEMTMHYFRPDFAAAAAAVSALPTV